MKVAILGYGTVGKKLYELLKDRYEVTGILNNVEEKGLLTCSIEKIFETKPETVFECLPNIPVAYEYDLAVLEHNINLISSNKACIQTHYSELVHKANEYHVTLSFEAAVAGGIPFLHTLLDLKKHDKLIGTKGIFNGTTNYILDSVFNSDTSYEEALNNAIRLGYAEANYSSDIDGDDVAYKVSLVLSLMFDTVVKKDTIVKYGVRYLNDKALAYAKENNYVIRLIGYGDRDNAFVLPMFIAKSDVFANISKNYNCVEIFSENQASIKMIGQGAGGLPTADAMVSDLLRPFDTLKTDKKLNISNNRKFRFVLADDSGLKVTEPMEINRLKDLVKENTFVGGLYD